MAQFFKEKTFEEVKIGIDEFSSQNIKSSADRDSINWLLDKANHITLRTVL